MNIIIVGAGKVGATVAEVLSNKNDVMVIEEDTAVAEKIKSLYNVAIFNESGTNPKVLEEAIVRHQAEIIISTVPGDADNLFICMMAKRIKPEIKTISRIRDPDYMVNDSYSIVDQIFSPELLSANTLAS
ncbi:MAG: NAD-binding protein, partial [Candidatus Methanomethylophilaceae archaeon]|nr:NAD-binding protein [Candidatus Methanomethylophilaceae archaeon]